VNKTAAIDIMMILQENPVFTVMSEDSKKALTRVARVFQCRGRTILHSAGQPAAYLFHVVSGQIELTTVTSEGQEGAVGTFGAGQWATWLAPFDGRPTERDIHAANGSTILAFPLEPLRRAFEQNPHAYPFLLKEISRRFRAVLRLQDARTIINRQQRIGQTLLLLAEFSAENPSVLHVKITRADLARRASCSRQTLYTALAHLESYGLIQLRYGGIDLPNPNQLRAFCAPS
jgi:CRP/FNR family transcriptional regulator, cyclic AMP receptor protein